MSICTISSREYCIHQVELPGHNCCPVFYVNLGNSKPNPFDTMNKRWWLQKFCELQPTERSALLFWFKCPAWLQRLISESAWVMVSPEASILCLVMYNIMVTKLLWLPHGSLLPHLPQFRIVIPEGWAHHAQDHVCCCVKSEKCTAAEFWSCSIDKAYHWRIRLCVCRVKSHRVLFSFKSLCWLQVLHQFMKVAL